MSFFCYFVWMVCILTIVLFDIDKFLYIFYFSLVITVRCDEVKIFTFTCYSWIL